MRGPPKLEQSSGSTPHARGGAEDGAGYIPGKIIFADTTREEDYKALQVAAAHSSAADKSMRQIPPITQTTSGCASAALNQNRHRRPHKQPDWHSQEPHISQLHLLSPDQAHQGLTI